jgi:hypothetical protein
LFAGGIVALREGSRHRRAGGAAIIGRVRRVVIRIAAALALAGAFALPAATAGAATRVGFWAGEEFKGAGTVFEAAPEDYWNPRDTSAWTPRLWRVLAREGVPLYVNLRYRRDFGPPPAGLPRRHDALPLIRHAQRLGIPLWAWVVVPYADGYWSYEGNAATTRAALRSLRRWAAREGIRFRGAAIDSEPSLEETNRLYAAFGSDPSQLSGYLDDTVDPLRQCAGVRAYAGILEWALERNLRVVAAAYPPVLDDLADGNLALQDALDVVTLPPRGWGAVYFMAYRSLYGQLFGAEPGSGLISSYFRSAQERLGAGGQVTLGIAGSDPYGSVESLAHDVRLLATLGARTVPIYSLEGAAVAFGPRGVAKVVRAAQRPFTGAEAEAATAPSPAAEGDRAQLASLDAAAGLVTPAITADHPGGAQAANAYEACGVD